MCPVGIWALVPSEKKLVRLETNRDRESEGRDEGAEDEEDSRDDSKGGSENTTREQVPKASRLLTLGTRAQIPTGHIVNTLRAQATCDSNVPSDQMLGTF